MNKLALITLSLFIAAPVAAQSHYVTDVFSVPLRSGQTTAYRIIAELDSGTPVEVLEQNEESGYSRIRTNRGTEGWIISRYLQAEPVARDRLTRAERQLTDLLKKNESLASDKNEAESTSESLEQAKTRLEDENSELTKELAYIKEVSGNTLTINQRNQDLNQENQELKNQVDLLTAENDRLKEDSRTDFFIYGAGTIFFGILLGLVIPSMKPKRKDSGWI